MKIGMMVGAVPGPEARLDTFVEFAKEVEAKGFPSLWMAQIFGQDAMTAFALAGQATNTIELGTAVTSIYRSHPIQLAQQALSTNAACGGRFRLGIGLAHQIVVENMFGMSYDKPARYMRDYMKVLKPIVEVGGVQHQGEIFKAAAAIDVPDSPKPVSIIIAAMGPVMLGIAGREADGTALWMTGAKTIEEHVVPTMGKAAAEAGKPTPRVMAGFPICLTNKVDETRAFIGETLVTYGQLPSYRAMLDREGIDGPADIALVGDEAVLDAELEKLAACGVTDFAAVILGPHEDDRKRTFDYLASKQ